MDKVQEFYIQEQAKLGTALSEIANDVGLPVEEVDMFIKSKNLPYGATLLAFHKNKHGKNTSTMMTPAMSEYMDDHREKKVEDVHKDCITTCRK